MKRDSASGDGIDVIVITKDQYTQMHGDDIKKIIGELGN